MAAAYIESAIEASLARLRTDRLDVYFVHHFDEKTPLEETLGALDRLVRKGKVRFIGASNFAAWQVEKALGISVLNDWAPFACIQPMYNLVKRQAEVEILPMAQAERLGVITYSPLGGGLLTGKYGSNFQSVPGRLSTDNIYQRRYGAESMMECAQKLVRFAQERGIHPITLAVAWVMRHPAVTAPILGARDVGQLEPLLAVADFRMTEDLYKALSALSLEPPPATDRTEETNS